MIRHQTPPEFRDRMARWAADLIVEVTPADARYRTKPGEDLDERATAWVVKGHLWPQAREACRIYRIERDHVEGLIWESAHRILCSFAWEKYPPPCTRWGAWANRWVGLEIFRSARSHGTGRSNPTAAPTVLTRALTVMGEDAESALGLLPAETDTLDMEELERVARLCMARLSLRGDATRRRMQVLGQRLAGVTLQGVSDRVGVTKERARQIQLQAVAELRGYLRSDDVPDDVFLAAGAV